MIETERPVSKWGVGVELTMEALIALIRERFPNLVDWEAITMMPSVEYSAPTQTWGMYFTSSGLYPATDESVGMPLRRVWEGGPVPTTRLRLASVDFDDGTPRCGYYYGSIVQCADVLGHEGEHTPETR